MIYIVLLLGRSSVNKSITISPNVVSRRTAMLPSPQPNWVKLTTHAFFNRSLNQCRFSDIAQPSVLSLSFLKHVRKTLSTVLKSVALTNY